VTTLEAEPTPAASPSTGDASRSAPRAVASGDQRPLSFSGRRLARILAVWSVVALASFLLVLYLVEPLFQQRTQHTLLAGFRAEISHAHFQLTLPGGSVQAVAPSFGASVGVLEIPGLRLRQVVVEGVGPTQTAKGPGHVPGTAGLGQPGNSAVVGRRSTYGGPFHSLDTLHPGDRILITTTQGQTVYSVKSVSNETITSSTSTDSGLGSPGATTPPVTSQFAPNPLPSRTTTVEDLYAPTKASQLTLVTSARVWPGNSSQGTVVVATMKTVPFVPTAQNGRTTGQTGMTGDGSAWVGLVLALQGFVLAGLAAAYLLPRYGPRVAYLLTTPPLIVFVILIAETGSQLLPAWY
jgi:sortase A